MTIFFFFCPCPTSLPIISLYFVCTRPIENNTTITDVGKEKKKIGFFIDIIILRV